MRRKQRWTGLVLALVGIGVCLTGVSGFVRTILANRLPWSPAQTARDYYLEVGWAYSQGFAMGFFLCFSLVLLMLVVSAWVRHHRRVAAALGDTRGSSAP